MKNSKKISVEELPALFGEKAGHKADLIQGKELDNLKADGVNFDGYTLREGDEIAFPAYEDMVVKQMAPREGITTKVTFVACKRTRNGKEKVSYFNVNSMAKRDADNNPVFPELYELGNTQARLQWLAEKGGIKAGKAIDVKVPEFRNGERVCHDELQEDGTMKSVPNTTTQTVYEILPIE